MFGYEYEIVKEFPHYFLDYREVNDADIRWTDRFVLSSGEWSGNLFDFYFKACAKLVADLKVPFVLADNGFDRIDDTPLHKILREAVANALLHSNYYERRGIVIEKKFNKEFIISNPGGLRISKSEAISGGISDPRNETLVKMFSLLNIGERAGSGLHSIYTVLKKENNLIPVLEEQFNPDRTTLKITIDTNNDYIEEKTREKIIELIRKNSKITTREMAENLGLTIKGIEWQIKSLQENNIIERIGSKKAGSWSIKK
ncbi:winged helix-turn-helix transcriptional regulator [Candidatus Ruminimicrobium bovinum]|uniref:winged helix-turn-helix transcriptional regulator n=1 Tax=Candidatus Ruminimicrobium bovinum TaxID=3242779 RepID=UPI0039B9523D